MGIIVADALPIVNSSAKRREYPERRSLEDSKNLLQIWVRLTTMAMPVS